MWKGRLFFNSRTATNPVYKWRPCEQVDSCSVYSWMMGGRKNLWSEYVYTDSLEWTCSNLKYSLYLKLQLPRRLLLRITESVTVVQDPVIMRKDSISWGIDCMIVRSALRLLQHFLQNLRLKNISSKEFGYFAFGIKRRTSYAAIYANIIVNWLSVFQKLDYKEISNRRLQGLVVQVTY